MAEIFTSKVRDISSEGLGVADHPDGRAFFVRGAWPGDEGDFEVLSIEKKYGFAKIHHLTKLSEQRVPNPCPHSGLEPGQCGGCSWLGISYKAQLEQKHKMVKYLLQRRNALIENLSVVLPVMPSPKELGYRNRAQFKTTGDEIGFVSPGTKTLAAIEDCLVLTDKNRETLKGLRAQLPSANWKPREPYIWSYIDIDEEIDAQSVQVNQRRKFKQANDAQNANMKSWLKQKLEDANRESTVLELFSGSGNFTEVLSDLGFKKIIASELDERAVESLNARQLPGVQGFKNDIFYPKEWKYLYALAKDAEILVLDPPREGFKRLPDFLERLKKLKKIYYISCDPAHFAGEMGFLTKMGWKIKEVQPIDQFPQTAHVELMAEIIF